jgi:hypothetical protein
MKKIMLITLFIMGHALPSFTQSVSKSQVVLNANDSLELLNHILPAGPSMATPDVIMLMENIGSTRQFEAAVALVNCLGYNLDPYCYLERRSQEDMIPAIGILKENFSEDICPILFYQAIITENEWMRERSAIAIRAIASPQTIDSLKHVFSLSTTINPNAKEFERLLETPNLIIELYSPIVKDTEKAIDSVEKPGGENK